MPPKALLMNFRGHLYDMLVTGFLPSMAFLMPPDILGF